MRSAYDRTGRADRKGQASEDYFSALAQAKGLNPRKSTKEEDRYQHIDFWITGHNDVTRSVDVKSAKRHTASDLFLVEIRNVNGDHGWVFGKADLIAFQYHDTFLVVRRQELLRLVCILARVKYSNGLINVDSHYQTDNKPAIAPYYYARFDRPNECITHITAQQLKPIVLFTLR